MGGKYAFPPIFQSNFFPNMFFDHIYGRITNTPGTIVIKRLSNVFFVVYN